MAEGSCNLACISRLPSSTSKNQPPCNAIPSLELSVAHRYLYQELRTSCGDDKAKEWLLSSTRHGKGLSCPHNNKLRRTSSTCTEKSENLLQAPARKNGPQTTPLVDLQIQPPSPQSIRSEDSVMGLESIYKSLIENEASNGTEAGAIKCDLMRSGEDRCFLGLLFTSEACVVLDKLACQA
eukprot:758788-Hanusia_phi.AAC.5